MLCGIDDGKGLLSLRSVVRIHPGAPVQEPLFYAAAFSFDGLIWLQQPPIALPVLFAGMYIASVILRHFEGYEL